jgi:hypothetical protein
VLVVVEDGMSNSAFSRDSTSKHRGAEMSSRLMPPKPGAMRTTVSTISSTSVQLRQIGTASTPPNSLNSTAFPSMTGKAACGPMSPRPSTAVPSVTIATTFAFHVRSCTSAGFCSIAVHTRATPGVYASDRSSLLRSGTVEVVSSFPPTCNANAGSAASYGGVVPAAVTIGRAAVSCMSPKSLSTRQ